MFQAARLVDARRQYHDRFLIENNLKLLTCFLNGLEHRNVMRQPGADDNLSERNRVAGQLAQTMNKFFRRRSSEACLRASSRMIEHRPILGHDVIEQAHAWKNR